MGIPLLHAKNVDLELKPPSAPRRQAGIGSERVTYLSKSSLVLEVQIVHIGNDRSLSLGDLIILAIWSTSGILAYDADEVLELFNSHGGQVSGSIDPGIG